MFFQSILLGIFLNGALIWGMDGSPFDIGIIKLIIIIIIILIIITLIIIILIIIILISLKMPFDLL
jgi:hypothetical protein